MSFRHYLCVPDDVFKIPVWSRSPYDARIFTSLNDAEQVQSVVIKYYKSCTIDNFEQACMIYTMMA